MPENGDKTVLFVFNGDPTCFVHVLLNALDMKERGTEVRIVVEGEATAVLPKTAEQTHPLHRMFKTCMEQSLFAGACRACSQKMGVLEQVEHLGMDLLDDMNGHPGMGRYQEQGYTVITF